MKYIIGGCQLYWFANKLVVTVDRVRDSDHLPRRRIYEALYSDKDKLVRLVDHATELVVLTSYRQAYYLANKFK